MAELKMLQISLGVTRMDKIRNEYIRVTAQVGWFGEKTREARLRWLRAWDTLTMFEATVCGRS